MKHKFKFFGWAYMTADKNGQPHGFTWLTACTSCGNFRLFPVGYVK